MPIRRRCLPRWFPGRGRSRKQPNPNQCNTHWIERDHVRSVLSFVILAALLTLIVIGGRKTWIGIPGPSGIRGNLASGGVLIAYPLAAALDFETKGEVLR
jgi:hypothetical protein